MDRIDEISPADILNEAELSELAFQCFRREIRELHEQFAERLFRWKYYEEPLSYEEAEKFALSLGRALVDFP